jgi:hypothetical protein
LELGRHVELQSVALYQPEDVVASRLPDGVAGLSTFIGRLVAAAADEFARDEATSRALVVAITPERCALWMFHPNGAVDERAGVRARLSSVARPRVAGGAVAFALFLRHGEDFPPSDGPPVPAEWAELAREAGTPLDVDEILTRLLA